MIGTNIKKYREEIGWTQKDLADRLNVTAQAVSRWEGEAVEPDIQTITKLASLFHVSIDQLLTNKEPEKEIVEVVVPQPVPAPQPRIVGTCTQCGKLVEEGDVGRTMSQPRRVRSGRTYHLIPAKPELVCRSCFKSEEAASLKRAKQQQEAKLEEKKGTFWKAFWFAGIASAFFIYAAFSVLFESTPVPEGSNPTEAFLTGLLLAYLVYATIFVLTMNNTFVNGMVAAIFDFGIVRMPGIIFSFDIDGLIFLIAMKIVLFFLGIGIALAFGLLGLILAVPFSAISFPFSLLGAFSSTTQVLSGEEK